MGLNDLEDKVHQKLDDIGEKVHTKIDGIQDTLKQESPFGQMKAAQDLAAKLNDPNYNRTPEEETLVDYLTFRDNDERTSKGLHIYMEEKYGKDYYDPLYRMFLIVGINPYKIKLISKLTFFCGIVMIICAYQLKLPPDAPELVKNYMPLLMIIGPALLIIYALLIEIRSYLVSLKQRKYLSWMYYTCCKLWAKNDSFYQRVLKDEELKAICQEDMEYFRASFAKDGGSEGKAV